MKITNSTIDGKVCSGTHAKGTDNDATTFSTVLTSTANTAQCSGLSTAKTKKFSDFAEAVKLQDGTHWPTGSYSNSNTPTLNEQNSNANAVAKDLVQELTPEEKTIVAGLLAKTIEGGEVVEIRAVSSTSVMVNACYDLLSEGLGVVPYACVGLGGNFVGVVDGHITPKLACGFWRQGKA
ncbi:surface antigen family protein [Anaplasma phagocytophilum str. CRT53-1]|uniref:Surface antigen family protein n=1 Tax=Anaplasma phagocytophilum str. CRT53-1 TaxID=1359157 RepID=A0A0F3PQD2_ANAPH|nr:surface antigen family protein [Anaplasma phagocytophilum str. CRT53-1]